MFFNTSTRADTSLRARHMHVQVPVYATTCRPDLAKTLGLHGAKYPLEHGPEEGDCEFGISTHGLPMPPLAHHTHFFFFERTRHSLPELVSAAHHSHTTIVANL
jgi:hypothetical protein